MAGGINLATRYIKEVDERWASESQAALVTGNGFIYKGDQTFVIYSIPYAPLKHASANISTRSRYVFCYGCLATSS